MEPQSKSTSRLFGPRAEGLFAVLCGGLVGSALRSGVSLGLPAKSGSFPTALVIVNVVGSFLLGLYSARRERAATARWSLQFWAIGMLGSFTTFSAFSVETVRLIDGGHGATALGYVLVSLIGGLSAALLGERLGEVLR